MTTLFVGHLLEQVTEEDLWSLFADYGVRSIEIMKDDTSKKPRGFAFVDIDGDACTAIREIGGKELYGVSIVVKAMA